MKYERYIELGFVRTDMDDHVEFRRTGYKGYNLNKDINSVMSISAYFTELDKPVLQVKKRGQCLIHRISITPEIVEDILEKI